MYVTEISYSAMRRRDAATLVDTNVLGYEVKYKDDINAHVLPGKDR